jgi:hypothetical protein
MKRIQRFGANVSLTVAGLLDCPTDLTLANMIISSIRWLSSPLFDTVFAAII